MNTTIKDTLQFCLQFVKTNINEASQKTQCRTWTKMAIDTINKEDLGAKDFIVAELFAIDRFLSGADGKMTSADALIKIETVNQLMG